MSNEESGRSLKLFHPVRWGLDAALGVGGYPRRSSNRNLRSLKRGAGKTNAGYSCHCRSAQKAGGGIAAIIDAEHAFDRFYAENLGVKMEEFTYFRNPKPTGEQALENAEPIDTFVGC